MMQAVDDDDLQEEIDEAMVIALDRLPNYVDDLVYETREDSGGDEAVFVWVLVQDDAADRLDGRTANRISRKLRRIFEDRRLPFWVYVRFRTVSEQEEIEQEGARR